MALNTVQNKVQVKEMDDTCEDEPCNTTKVRLLWNPHEFDDLKYEDTEGPQVDNEWSECKVCEKKFLI